MPDVVQKTREYKLPRAPSSVAFSHGRIYIATKSRLLYSFQLTSSEIKKMPFPEVTVELACSDNIVFCGTKDGKVKGLAPSGSVCFSTAVGGTAVTRCWYDSIREELLVSTYGKKVLVYGINGILKNTFYFYSTPLVDFAVSRSGAVAGVSQNNQTVKVVNECDGETKELRVKSGFPECVLYLKSGQLVVGTTDGCVVLFDKKGVKHAASHEFSESTHSLIQVSENFIAVGVGTKLHLMKVAGKSLEEVQEVELGGIPVDMAVKDGILAVAVGREPRLGRWNRLKKGRNKLVLFNTTG